MGNRRMGLGRMEKLIERLKRSIEFGAGTILSGQYLSVKNVTADTTLTTADSAKIVLVDPAATTAITLPTTLVSGWHVSVILDESATGEDAGMDQIVNIDLGSGTNLANVGLILEVDGAAGDHCVANDDWVTCSAAASPGDRFDIFTDGNRWYVYGTVKDVTECVFATAAAA
ncbi:MAG: hypothetical protein CMI54_00025 [Parcubacteria group bacterium]|nr:hypothetical protein [Parcubacteria group bacterium]|tara:strand:- start:5112 stop:5627 length:516 start_codon:yes stop_codon:yes gene_type:complete